MRVTLLPDPNFQIRQKSKAMQETGPDLAATWQWDVKPAAEGTHTLIAQVDVLEKTNGRFQVFNRYSRRVSVHVGVGTIQDVLNRIRDAETIGDALTALFKSLRATLLALAGLLLVGFGLRSLIRRHRKRRPNRQLSNERDPQTKSESSQSNDGDAEANPAPQKDL